MSKPDGGPAFPYGVERRVRDGYGEGERVIDENEKGMTLRDYFAAHAIQGMLSNLSTMTQAKDDGGKYLAFHVDNISLAYEIADAMLAERNK